MSSASSDEALTRLKEYGVLLLSDSKFPNVCMIVAGSPVKGSWWAHPKAHAILQVVDRLSNHPDVLVTKLLSGKVTFVHRRLWPVLMAVAARQEPWQLRGLSSQAHQMLEHVMTKEEIRTDKIDPHLRLDRKSIGEVVRELETRLLVLTREIHTESGTHAKILQTWERWAKQAGALSPNASVEEAMKELEGSVRRINAGFAANAQLPWG